MPPRPRSRQPRQPDVRSTSRRSCCRRTARRRAPPRSPLRRASRSAASRTARCRQLGTALATAAPAAAAGGAGRGLAGLKLPGKYRGLHARHATRCCARPCGRLADDPRQAIAPGITASSIRSRATTSTASAPMGLVDDRRRLERARADRPRRRALSVQPRQRDPGARRRERRAALGEQVGPSRPAARMRGIAIYDDKVYIATNDARLVALDARTGQTVWETIIGERTEGDFRRRADRSSSRAKSSRAWATAPAIRKEKCFISAYDAKDGQAIWRSTRSRATPSPAPTPGATYRTISARAATPGSPAATIPTSTSRTGASRRRSRGCPRAAASSMDDDALYTSSTLALDPTPASSNGTSSTRPASRSISTMSSSACSSMSAARRRVHGRQGRHSLEARPHDRQVPRSRRDGVPECLGQASIPRPASRTIAHDIIEHEDRRMGPGLPEHRRRPQLASDELSHAPTRQLIIPLVAELHRDARPRRSSR